MANTNFVFDSDSADFIRRMSELEAAVLNANYILESLGQGLTTAPAQEQILALNVAISENKEKILILKKEILDLGESYQVAIRNGDLNAVGSLTDEMEKRAAQIGKLNDELEQYHSALELVEEHSDIPAPSVSEASNAPQFYTSEKKYERAQVLREKSSRLESDIAGFSGSDKELQKLKKELDKTRKKLNECEREAAQAAASLGTELGSKAAQAADRLYKLNDQVKEQKKVVKNLQSAVKEAADEMARFQKAGDTDAAERSRIQMETLAASYQNAQLHLLELQGSQEDAQQALRDVNREIASQDSRLVKMLGGYDNYKTIIGAMPEPIQKAASSIEGMTGAAKAFIATPLGFILGVIVLALQALDKWFNSSIEGQLAFARINTKYRKA